MYNLINNKSNVKNVTTVFYYYLTTQSSQNRQVPAKYPRALTPQTAMRPKLVSRMGPKEQQMASPKCSRYTC